MVLLGSGSLLLISLVLVTSSRAMAEMPMGRRGNQMPVSTNRSPPLVRWHNTMSSGWAEAKRRQLPMVIFITSKRCRYCDAMKKDVWCDREISARLTTGFVAIRLTPQENSKTLNRIKIEAYPTTLIGTPEGKIIDQQVGYQPSPSVHQMLSRGSLAVRRR